LTPSIILNNIIPVVRLQARFLIQPKLAPVTVIVSIKHWDL